MPYPNTPEGRERQRKTRQAYRDAQGPRRGQYVPPALTPAIARFLRLLATFGFEGTFYSDIRTKTHRNTIMGSWRRGYLNIAKLPVDNVKLSELGWLRIAQIAPGLLPRIGTQKTDD